MTEATVISFTTKILFLLALLVGTVSPSFAAKKPKASVPRIDSDYINVYRAVDSILAITALRVG